MKLLAEQAQLNFHDAPFISGTHDKHCKAQDMLTKPLTTVSKASPSKLSQTQSHKKWNSPVFVLGAFFKQIVTAFNATVKSTDLPWLSLYSCTRICATACRIMKALHYLTFRWVTIPEAPNPRTIKAKIPKP